MGRGRAKRLADEPLAVKEGDVRAWPSAPTARPSPPATTGGGVLGGGVVLWDVAGRKRLAERPLAVTEGGVRSVAFSPDGKTLAAGLHASGVASSSAGWCCGTWPGGSGWPSEPLAVKEGGGVTSVAFSPDGKTLAAGYYARGGGGGGVVLWDVAGRKRLAERPLDVPEGGVQSVAFSPDGTTLAAGYADRIGAINTLTGDIITGDIGVAPAAITGDGSVVSSGGVVLWDVAGRKRLAERPLDVPEGGVQSVAFSPDGTTLATGIPRRCDAVGRGRAQAAGPGRAQGRRQRRGLQPRRHDPGRRLLCQRRR